MSIILFDNSIMSSNALDTKEGRAIIADNLIKHSIKNISLFSDKYIEAQEKVIESEINFLKKLGK